jgi:hypothetical protein
MNGISTNFQLDYDLANLTPRELSEQIIGRLENTFSIQLMHIFKTEALTERQKFVRFKDALYNGILQRAEAENLSEFFVAPQDLTEREERDYLESEGGGDVGIAEIEIEPLIALAEKDVEIIKSYQGEDLKTYLFTLTKRFENMVIAKTPAQLAASLLQAGVLGIGTPFAFATGRALLSGATLAAAIRSGIQRIGFGTVISVVVVVLALLLLFFLFENPKKVLGMVINQTAEDFVVHDFRKPHGDLYVNAGEIKNFMEDNADGLGSAKVQLKGTLSFGEGDDDNIVFAGIYFIDKKFGVFGAEGLALFSSTTSDLRFAHLFASPYTRDNGTNMAFLPGKSQVDLKNLFKFLYDSRRVRVITENDRFKLVSTVNDPRGGVVGCIASITAKA